MALNFWVPPSWPKMALNPKKLKIDLISIFNHEGGSDYMSPNKKGGLDK